MIVVDAPALPPGKCFLTNTSEGRMVDTFLDVDDVVPTGRIYLAETTISDLAQMFGFTPPVASARLKDRVENLTEQIGRLQAALTAQIAVNAALTHAGYEAPEPEVDVPSGTIEDVLAWVDAAQSHDEELERAKAALDAEEGEPKPRVTLVGALTDLIELLEAE